jgi:RNA polymerase sigma-70 factor (ECF subfamily)
MDADDDSALVAAAREGDAAAFERLVGRYTDPVYRVVAGYLGREDAEDASQEVFIRAHQGLRGFAGDASFRTWIYRIAVNVALTRVGRRSRTSGARLDSIAEPAAGGDGPGDAALAEERREAVRRAVLALPEKERAVAVLRGMEGLAFEEIAGALGIKRPTAESRMNRAKERLRRLLRRWVQE